jgi:hypothetical protein
VDQILFKPELEQAIINDLKTETRRVIEYPLADITRPGLPQRWRVTLGKTDTMASYKSLGTDALVAKYARYQPGSVCWVRTTWAAPVEFDDLKPSLLPRDTPIHYGTPVAGEGWGKARPSIFMPRWASRVSIHIDSVGVEFLQTLTKAGAVAEGIAADTPDPVAAFARLWDSINAERGFAWADNPAVFVYKFSKVEVNQ